MVPVYASKISCKAARVALKVLAEMAPSFFAKRCLSTVRIWSSTINPLVPAWVTGIRKGAEKPLDVMGATMTVRRCLSARRQGQVGACVVGQQQLLERGACSNLQAPPFIHRQGGMPGIGVGLQMGGGLTLLRM